jgi:hypothetical protein
MKITEIRATPVNILLENRCGGLAGIAAAISPASPSLEQEI